MQQTEVSTSTTTDVRLFTYGRESVSEIKDEITPLLEKHFKEISANQDIPLDPDWETYERMDSANCIRVYTCRKTADGDLVGYAVFFVRSNLHYKSSIQAVQDILFINKDYRGKGRHFIRWCDQQLKSEGCQVVYHHIKNEHNFGPLLERMGYKLVDLIYSKRLDK